MHNKFGIIIIVHKRLRKLEKNSATQCIVSAEVEDKQIIRLNRAAEFQKL
jgi:hypothetical protein